MTNKPWCYTWDEVMDMPLMALALIWSEQEQKGLTLNEAIEKAKSLRKPAKRKGELRWDSGRERTANIT